MTRSTSTARLVIFAMATVALGLGACGTDEGSSPADGSSLVIESDADGVIADADTESDAPAATSSPAERSPETTAAASEGTTASTSDDDAPASGVGQAVVDVDADRYEFVVIQCLRNVTGPLSDAVIEFQLDGVPAATPPDVVERLLGVIGDDVDVFAELEPVVAFGPILSITQVAGGGEAFYVTDLGSIEITSDGDPTNPASRSLDVSSDATGARVTGTSTAGGRSVTVDATCP